MTDKNMLNKENSKEMKLQIEKRIPVNYKKAAELSKIQKLVRNTNNENDLRSRVKMSNNDSPLTFFEVGFGGHHMWIHDKELRERVAIVKF